MKELSIEEKAYGGNYKTYTELINRLEDVKDAIKKQNYGIAMDILCKSYPEFKITTSFELKESEDDKMRKIISDILLIDSDEIREILDANNVLMQDIDAWLEKQGEQIDNLTPQEAMDIAVAKCFDEQKPADTIKPKFKVGDWVMLDRPVLITKVEDMPYNTHQYFTSDGTWFGDGTKAKLWNIQDAKDGDLLADDYGIYIFDRFDESDERCFLCMGAYQYSQKVFENEHMLCSVEVHPATKEQRDLLFQKMHEAGYEWDAEKKELNEIEQKPAECNNSALKDKLLELFQRFRWYCKDETPTNGDIIEYVDAHIQELIGTMQKPAWSEEDEARIESCIKLLQTSDGYDTINTKWLKSLRGRVQPKQKWSEEDKKMWLQVINEIEAIKSNSSTVFEKNIAQDKIDWLKSLRLQSQWKPSDEQMAALNYVVNLMASSERPTENDLYYNILKSLREQLNKLMEK